MSSTSFWQHGPPVTWEQACHLARASTRAAPSAGPSSIHLARRELESHAPAVARLSLSRQPPPDHFPRLERMEPVPDLIPPAANESRAADLDESTASPGPSSVDLDELRSDVSLRDSNESMSILIKECERTSDGVMPFISKMALLLSTPDLYGDVFFWNETGTHFILCHNSPTLTATILPLFFAHNRIASFQRQLNVYGFKRVPSTQLYRIFPSHADLIAMSDADYIAYFHPSFTRAGRDGYASIRPKISRARVQKALEKAGRSSSRIERLSEERGTMNEEHEDS